MYGTTRCPYCTTRFKVTETQMEAHSGMVRCGYCRQTFDARPSFERELPSPQLELPMPQLDLPVLDTPVSPPPPTLPVLQPMTLAERVAIVEDENDDEAQTEERIWPWTLAALLAGSLLVAQAAFYFRIDIAAHQPSLKPALISYCSLLGCDVPLPQYADLMGIESSDLEADTEHQSRIVLNALLRNRAEYAQAYPHLELTLTDSQDKPLARRTFRPDEYLPPSEKTGSGFRPNRELAVTLNLDTGEITPMGYRLLLFYPEENPRG